MRLELILCEQTLLDEISCHEAKRLDVAKTYSLALRSSEAARVNWAKVNDAIIKRWSRSGLRWIKNKAWSGTAFRDAVEK